MALHELTDFEWKAIQPHLPNKPRGVPRVHDRRVLNGIFWCCALERPGVIPERYGPQSLQPVAQGRRWDRLMDAIVKAHDGDVQMIDTSIARVHQRARRQKGGSRSMSGSLARLPHNQDPSARRQERPPLKLKVTVGQKSDIESATEMIAELPKGAMLLADKGYDANGLRHMVTARELSTPSPTAKKPDLLLEAPLRLY